MKKLKINFTKDRPEVLSREQLRLITGGNAALESCQGYGSPCETSGALKCCGGFVCQPISVDYSECRWATL